MFYCVYICMDKHISSTRCYLWVQIYVSLGIYLWVKLYFPILIFYINSQIDRYCLLE